MLQFLLAGALVVAWIWMLGRPLLTMLARRSRRDSVGHFRYQQAALGRTVGVDPLDRVTSPVVRPFVDWWAQPVERRRLQLLLGGVLATFASALLAIALRGAYIRLFLVMTMALTAHLVVAAAVGTRELRRREAASRRRAIDAAVDRSAGRAVSAGVAEASDRQEEPYEIDDLLTNDGLGGGLFDEGFFEPIPELDRQSGSRATATPVVAEPDQEVEPDVEPNVDVDAPVEPAASGADQPDASFTAPPTPRPRHGRWQKARPIYVEPEVEEGDDAGRAVND